MNRRFSCSLLPAFLVLFGCDATNPEPSEETGGNIGGSGANDATGGAASSGGAMGLGGDGSGGDGSGGVSAESGGGGSGGTATGGNSAGGTTSSGGTATGGNGTGGAEGDPACSSAGTELVRLVNEYRQENGKPEIPLSPSLCTVASSHTADLVKNPETVGGSCNLHSWSDDGPWTGCCYTSDHAKASCMWDKPDEITVYTDTGFEVSASGVDTPEKALALWKASSGHNAVLLSTGIWKNYSWGAIGADLGGGYAHLWVGVASDPADL